MNSFRSQLIHVQVPFVMVIMVSLIQKFPEHISSLLAYRTNICSSNVGYKNNVLNFAQCVIVFVSINDLLNDLTTRFHSVTWYIPRSESDGQYGQHRQRTTVSVWEMVAVVGSGRRGCHVRLLESGRSVGGLAAGKRELSS
jgi:hypothetical protein